MTHQSRWPSSSGTAAVAASGATSPAAAPSTSAAGAPTSQMPPAPGTPVAPAPMTCLGGSVRPGDSTLRLNVAGQMRTSLLHIPMGYDPQRPSTLILAFHGSDSDGDGARYLSHLNDSSDRHGFIVAFPNGLDGGWSGAHASDDITFVNALLDQLFAELCIDSQRVFAAGFSAGGYLSYRLMCELGQRFRAIAPVEGAITIASCMPAKPISVIHFHGTADNAVSYQRAVDSIGRVRQLDACSAVSSVVFAKGDASCERWASCSAGTQVELCTIQDGGHQWAGGGEVEGLGHISTDLDATETMVQFFADVSR